MVTESKPVAGEPRSRRGRQRLDLQVLTPLDQIRKMPNYAGVEASGSWAYYLRPEGATIRDALILYPNGGIPDIADERLKARYGTNAEYYRNRQRQKGFEFVGPTLTESGVARLVEILADNRDDEIIFCEDEIANCADVIKNADRPEIRDQARKRKRLFEKRLDTIKQPFDPDALLAELKEIARAQMLASVDPNVLRVMRAMIGEVNAKTESMIAAFQSGKVAGEPSPARLRKGGGDATVFDATGRSSIE